MFLSLMLMMPASPPPLKEKPAAVSACDCGGAGNCQCGPGCKCKAKYADVLARVLAGETLFVASGVEAAPGQVACDIPGEPDGIYHCYSVCYGRGVPCKAFMVRLAIPKKMEAKERLPSLSGGNPFTMFGEKSLTWDRWRLVR